MAITTYAELQTAITDTLIRDDVATDAVNWIALAEAQMQRDLRHWRMEKRDTLTVDSQFEDLPTDFLAPIRLSLTASAYQYPLDPITADDMQDRRGSVKDTAGVPCAYAVVGDQFEFFPTPDDTYTANVYYRRTIPALSVSNTTNWLLTLAPDLYLYGSLLHSAPLLQEDARLATWGGLYSTAVEALNMESKRGKRGTGRKLRMRA